MIRSSSSPRCRVEQAQQRAARRGVLLAGDAQRVGVVDRGAQEGVGALDRRGDLRVDHLVVGLEHVEAVGEARLGGLKHREIVQILDLVMGVELLQEELQPRRKPGAEVLRGRGPFAERRGRRRRARRRSRGTCRGAAARSAPWRRDWRGRPTPRADSGRSAGAGRPASRRGCRGQAQRAAFSRDPSSGLDNR